ncbi:hypothetical protein WKS98_01820 [Lagierella sp. ICN-221743]
MKRKIISIIQALLVLILAWSVYKIYSYKNDNQAYKVIDNKYKVMRDKSNEKIKRNLIRGR